MKKNTPKRTSKKKADQRRPLLQKYLSKNLVVAAVIVMAFAAAALVHHAGPLNSVFSPKSSTAPLVQQDTTKLYTADGLASSSTILVKFSPSLSANAVAAVHQANGGKIKKNIAGIGVQEVKLAPGADVGAALKAYRGHNGVEYAEPNSVAQRFMTPNDTLYSKQWNLAKINAEPAWDISQASAGPIAVIDSGVDSNHTDLSGEVMTGYNFINDSSDTSDDNGHGTHVAGIIAGISNNASGVASIGFKGSIMPVKVLDSTGSGTYADLASGIVYAADHGAKVINMSLGGSSDSQTLASAVSYAENKGVIVVAAAGNNGNSAAVYPADYPGVIAVAATTDDDNLASFSSFGSSISLSAPGVSIISTYNNGGYATMSGTSMAAPEVAGLIGLALSHGQASGTQLVADLEQTSDKVGPYPYNTSGWNQYFGYGRINAAKLMQLIGSTAATTPTPPTESPSAPAPTSQLSHGQPGVQFSVDLEGSIDSVDAGRGVITVKIQSISQSLKLANNNLVDLYISGSTSITNGNQNLSLSDLSPGDKLSGKALWQNNQLSAITINVQGSPKSVRTSQPVPASNANAHAH